MLARRATSEEEDRNVCAADEQEHDDSSEQEDECPGEAAQDFFIERDDLDAPFLRIILWVVLRKAVHQRLHLRLHGGIFRAGLQLDEGIPVIVRIGIGNGGEIDVIIAPGETRRHDAYDRVAFVIKLDRFSNHIVARAILALPEEIAEDRNRLGVAAWGVGRSEFTAEQWRNAHVVKHIWGI